MCGKHWFKKMHRQEFCQRQLQLLDEERQAELDQESLMRTTWPPKQLERHGLALLSLSVSNIRSSLGGKTLLDLEPGPGRDPVLPAQQKFRVGDIAALEPVSGKSGDSGGKRVTGVVYRVLQTRITLSLSGKFLLLSHEYCRRVARDAAGERQHLSGGKRGCLQENEGRHL